MPIAWAVEGGELTMYVVALVFGLPMLIAGAMISPDGLHLGGFLTVMVILLVVLPFIAWGSFAQAMLFPPAGQSRAGSALSLWLGGTLTAVAVLFWLCALMGYPPAGALIDPSRTQVGPFMPRAGVAIGLFSLSMLVSCGCWGAISPILRPQVALSGALISGCVLFLVVYGAGWVLLTG